MKKTKILYYGIGIGWLLALLLMIWILYRQSLEQIPNGHTVFMMVFSAIMAVVFFLKARKIESF